MPSSLLDGEDIKMNKNPTFQILMEEGVVVMAIHNYNEIASC